MGAGAALQRETAEPTARLVARVAEGAERARGALRARCREVLEHAEGGWAAAQAAEEDACPKLATVRAAAAAELGVVLLPCDTPPERLHGSWVENGLNPV